jgi:hypothetical protein
MVGGNDPNNFLVRIEFIQSKIYEIDQRGLNQFLKPYCFYNFCISYQLQLSKLITQLGWNTLHYQMI